MQNIRKQRMKTAVIDDEGGSMSDRTLEGAGFYRATGSGGQLDMSGGAALLIGNGDPSTGVGHGDVPDNMSIGDMSVLVPVPPNVLGQGGWQDARGRESLLDAHRVAATHPGLYAQINTRATQVKQEVHHHYPQLVDARSQMDHVVQEAQLREAQLKAEVAAELGQRDTREAMEKGKHYFIVWRPSKPRTHTCDNSRSVWRCWRGWCVN